MPHNRSRSSVQVGALTTPSAGDSATAGQDQRSSGRHAAQPDRAPDGAAPTDQPETGGATRR